MNVYVCISKALESDNLPLFIVSRNKDICRREKARNVVFRLLGGLNLSDNHFCLFVVSGTKTLPEGDMERNGTLCSTSLNDKSQGNICVACNHVTQRCRKYLYRRCKHAVFRDLLFLSHRNALSSDIPKSPVDGSRYFLHFRC